MTSKIPANEVRRKTAQRPIYAGDRLWEILMQQLRDQAFCLTPLMRNLTGVHGELLKYEYEAIICKIEDLTQIGSQIDPTQEQTRLTKLQQLASDISESCLRRFGEKSSAPLLMLIDQDLPALKTQTKIVSRIIDCLVRSSRLAHPQSRREITFSYKKLAQQNVQVTISTSALPFACEPSRRAEIVEMFNAGNYLFAVKDFGVELCCAFHLIKKLGGEIKLAQADDGRTLIKVKFECEADQAPTAIKPIKDTICVWANSEIFARQISRVAEFHKLKMRGIKSLKELPKKSLLIYDFIEPRPELLTQLSELNPQNTLLVRGQRNFLESERDANLKQIEKATGRFLHQTNIPLVSSRLLQDLAQLCKPPLLEALPHALRANNQNLNVLVVDDTETARILIKDVLEQGGHSVEEANDGTDIQERIQAGNIYDLIISDINMCHLDGTKALKWLRNFEDHNQSQRTPVALMTAYGVDSKQNTDGGYDWMLRKPVEITELQTVIQIALEKKRAKQRAKQSQGASMQTEIILLDELKKRCGGRSKIVIKLLESFIDAAQNNLPKLSAQAASDQVTLVKTLHTLKGLLREISAQQAATEIESLESKAKQGSQLSESDLAAVSAVVGQVRGQAIKIREELIAEGA